MVCGIILFVVCMMWLCRDCFVMWVVNDVWNVCCFLFEFDSLQCDCCFFLVLFYIACFLCFFFVCVSFVCFAFCLLALRLNTPRRWLFLAIFFFFFTEKLSVFDDINIMFAYDSWIYERLSPTRLIIIFYQMEYHFGYSKTFQ